MLPGTVPVNCAQMRPKILQLCIILRFFCLHSLLCFTIIPELHSFLPVSPLLDGFISISQISWPWVCHLPATNWHLPSASTRIKSCAAIGADFQPLLKGGTLCSGQGGGGEDDWQNWSSERDFQEAILWAQYLYLLKSRKALKSFMVTTAPYDLAETFMTLAETFMTLAEDFCKKNICAWLHVFPLHQNHLYTDLRLSLFGAVSQRYLRCCLLGCSPHFAHK